MTAHKNKNTLFRPGTLLKCCLLFFTSLLMLTSQSWSAEGNVMTSLNIDESAPAPTVRITTENPVGYRYTVYDSIDPIRIVIDFPGMDVESILSLKDLSGAPVESIDVSSFDLTSGKLGRVEIVLGQLINYDIAIDGTDFTVAFAETVDEVAASPEVVQQSVQPEPAAVVAAEPEVPPAVEPETPSAEKLLLLPLRRRLSLLLALVHRPLFSRLMARSKFSNILHSVLPPDLSLIFTV